MALNLIEIKRKRWLEAQLDKVQSVIDGTLDSQAAEMTFNGRSITRFSPLELDRLYQRWLAEWTKLDSKESGTASTKIRTRF